MWKEDLDGRDRGFEGQYRAGGAVQAIGYLPKDPVPESRERGQRMRGRNEEVGSISEYWEYDADGQPAGKEGGKAFPWARHGFDGRKDCIGQ